MNGRILGVIAALALLIGVAVVGLRQAPQGTQADDAQVVTVYTALDEEFSRPVVERFEKETGIRVDFLTDAESTKTVGLTSRLLEEHKQGRPRCDVFWNNEVVNTIRLKQQGVLAEYRPEAAKDYPETFKDPDGTWTGFAARARVLIVNTELVKPEEYPSRLEDLLDPKWKGKIAIAKPDAGSTTTWIAVLHAREGQDKVNTDAAALQAKGIEPVGGLDSQLDVLATLQKNGFLKIVSGNKASAQGVSSGGFAMGFTDTDDAIVEKESGKPVDFVYLDSAPDAEGTLFFPNAVSLVAGAPHGDNGRKLIEYLLSPKVEIMLAQGASAQIPVNPAVEIEPRIATPKQIKPMPVDWARVAEVYPESMQWSKTTFGF